MTTGTESGQVTAALRAVLFRTLDRLSLRRVVPEKVVRDGRWLCVGGDVVALDEAARIVLVAIGKAAYPMAAIVTDLLGPYRATGLVSGLDVPDERRAGLAYFAGGHPYPNRASLAAGEAVCRLLDDVGPRDLVLYLLSGGGSAICERPVTPAIELDDCRELYRALVTSGMPVLEINFVRKHLSAIKGGRMTERAWPARQITLYVSDAPSGHPSNVASGPTMPDESTVEDCYEIVRRWRLADRLPVSVRRLFARGRIAETPKPGAAVFETSRWHCLLDPEKALRVAAEEAAREGWVVAVDRAIGDDWPLERATAHLLDRLEAMRRRSARAPVAVVAGGELSCPVRGDGLGGRNQAFVLDCVARIAGRPIAVLSAGTDGIDGVSPAAGAVADGTTLARARRRGLDPEAFAARSDSYRFFSSLGDAIVTGPTGNNVRDLRILVSW